VTFGSEASNLVFGDTNGHADIFLHDLEGEEFLIFIPMKFK
jgi:hypothetical protein